MSVEPSTSVKSGLNFDNDFIETSTSIDEQEFRTHPKKQLESDIQVSVKDEEMKSEWGKLIKKKKEESMNAPGKCPICEKVFVKIEDYRNHVWPLQLEETSRDYINWLGHILNELQKKIFVTNFYVASKNIYFLRKKWEKEMYYRIKINNICPIKRKNV